MKTIRLLITCYLFISVSCEKEPEVEEYYNIENIKAKSKKRVKPIPLSSEVLPVAPTEVVFPENLRTWFLPEDVEDLCKPTELTPIVLNYLVEIFSDSVATVNYDRYLKYNQWMTLNDMSEQYFGKGGEYTNLVQKRTRELERFWAMQGEIRVNGQHSESLNDRDKLAAFFYSLLMDDSSWEEAYMAADELMAINKLSPYLPESPLFSGDGLITSTNIIIIGDGLVEMFSETGIDPKIIWTGILAHEWSHQIQFDHSEEWYDFEPFEPGHPIYLAELEADFFAAYFLTHKRGATYNWKRTQEFLNLFFLVGDCAVYSPGHHGTPLQRMTASRLGYELAQGAQKKGFILTADEVHAAFNLHLPRILSQH